MFFGVPAVVACFVVYHCYSREAIGDVIHAYSEYILGCIF